MLSLAPSDISTFIRKNPEKDLPLMLHYWKLGLYEDHNNETELYNYLLAYGIGWNDTNSLIKTKLGSEIIKNIYLEREPLSVILKSHLLFENFIDCVFTTNKIKIGDLSFFSKINLLRNRSILKKDVFNDLSLLNNLRNEYGHNYYFDISSFDVSKFSICKGLYEGLPLRKKKTRAVLNLKTLQYYVIFNILGRMSYDFPYLYKLKPKIIPHSVFFDDVAQKMGEMIAVAYRQVEGTKVGLKINVEFCTNEPTTIKFYVGKDKEKQDFKDTA